jgi:predicted permease
MNRLKLAPAIFLIAFCIAYVVVFAMNWPMFRYYPLHGNFEWGPGDLQGAGPAMAWYGLLSSAAAFALLPALVISDRSIPAALRGYIWVLPCLAMAACVFLLRGLFA